MTAIAQATATEAATIAYECPHIVAGIKGKGSAKRKIAYMRIASLSLIEHVSRGETIANLGDALGPIPTAEEVQAAQVEWMSGRVASRLPAGEFPKGTDIKDDGARIDAARALILHYAMPGTKRLKAGQMGNRSDMQHKAIRAATEAWSMVLAELGLGNAKTQAEKDAQKKTRATNSNPVRGDGKGKDKSKDTSPAPTPTLSETLPNGGRLKSAAEVCRVVETAAATLLALANKNAKLLPTDYGMAIHAFKAAITKAASERHAREQAAEAGATK